MDVRLRILDSDKPVWLDGGHRTLTMNGHLAVVIACRTAPSTFRRLLWELSNATPLLER